MCRANQLPWACSPASEWRARLCTVCEYRSADASPVNAQLRGDHSCVPRARTRKSHAARLSSKRHGSGRFVREIAWYNTGLEWREEHDHRSRQMETWSQSLELWSIGEGATSRKSLFDPSCRPFRSSPTRGQSQCPDSGGSGYRSS